ncbi:hypothetical protein AMR42_11845 [Limnothrix sp. PR1529]|nr:hypothetical protein BCR12_02740 [Limnothrix sp. P13C2]PIB09936.1 hypothetical protein AMR42_11845 [Limnothrix sp. PR1529]
MGFTGGFSAERVKQLGLRAGSGTGESADGLLTAAGRSMPGVAVRGVNRWEMGDRGWRCCELLPHQGAISYPD